MYNDIQCLYLFMHEMKKFSTDTHSDTIYYSKIGPIQAYPFIQLQFTINYWKLFNVISQIIPMSVIPNGIVWKHITYEMKQNINKRNVRILLLPHVLNNSAWQQRQYAKAPLLFLYMYVCNSIRIRFGLSVLLNILLTKFLLKINQILWFNITDWLCLITKW